MRHAVLQILGLIMFLTFQNFTYVDWASVRLAPINNLLREKHARELLGSQYGKIRKSFSLVAKDELNQSLHHLVKDNLDEKNLDLSLDISSSIIQESQKYNLDPLFVMAVIQTESKFNPEIIGSHGEIGLMQIKPDTAAWIVEKYKLDITNEINLKDPKVNIQIGTAYLSYLRTSFPKKPTRYIAAYNMGPRNVRKLTAQNKSPKDYPERVLGNYKQIYQQVSDRSNRKDI